LNKRKRSLKKTTQASLPTVARRKNDNLNEIHKWHFKPLLKSNADQYAAYIIPQLKTFLSSMTSQEKINQDISTKEA
jgi:hypothetical protein